MPRDDEADQTERIAREALDLLGTGRQVLQFSSRYPGFDLATAYRVAARLLDLRRDRGETAVGRKIGFTNRTVWDGFGISAPIWNYVFDSTLADLISVDERFAIGRLTEPRIEPEIVLHLATAPRAGMSEEELLGCIDWVAHGFELVYSIFPGWKFTAADAVAGYGVHAALLLGERHATATDRQQWLRALSSFTVELRCDDGTRRSGQARDVLGGPLSALRHLVEELAHRPALPPLVAGETVTTGTLTQAMPIAAGQVWSTALAGIDLQGLRLRIT
jgi:2-oxo-3-hexenedioate decarboxylase